MSERNWFYMKKALKGRFWLNEMKFVFWHWRYLKSNMISIFDLSYKTCWWSEEILKWYETWIHRVDSLLCQLKNLSVKEYETITTDFVRLPNTGYHGQPYVDKIQYHGQNRKTLGRGMVKESFSNYRPQKCDNSWQCITLFYSNVWLETISVLFLCKMSNRIIWRYQYILIRLIYYL